MPPPIRILKKLFDIGVAGLTLMVPFLAAYIGYSIAERSALAPCAIGAWVGNSFGAGFFRGTYRRTYRRDRGALLEENPGA